MQVEVMQNLYSISLNKLKKWRLAQLMAVSLFTWHAEMKA